ncbi:MAG: alpha-L-rhamnosidase N-terminal domain-containing protein, partial [Planctomycetales bacterium]|nr:alpha-L-rhamnosidase N-terminal domain-containing protein [Planctomycetales bacterium]
MRSQVRGATQSAWQIVAASSADLLREQQVDLWDSGKQSGDSTLHVPYNGPALRSSQEVYWRVRSWDEQDRPSSWSPIARFTMGMLYERDWRAQWIVAPWQTESVLMRKSFRVRPGLKRAVAHVCGLGHFEMSLNGRKSGDGLLAPGWTKYNRTCLYETHEITQLLEQGENVVGLVLGDGMYHTERR